MSATAKGNRQKTKGGASGGLSFYFYLLPFAFCLRRFFPTSQ